MDAECPRGGRPCATLALRPKVHQKVESSFPIQTRALSRGAPVFSEVPQFGSLRHMSLPKTDLGKK